jgi:hypothetical protein
MVNWNLVLLESVAISWTIDLQCVGNLGGLCLFFTKGKCKGNEETTTGNDDEYQDSNHVLNHETESDEELRKVLVVIQDAECTWEQQHGGRSQDIVSHVRSIMLTRSRNQNAIEAEHIVGEEANQDAQVKSVPHTHNVESETLLRKTYEFVEHVSSTPKPKDNLEWSNFSRTINQDGQEQTQHDGEGEGREELSVTRYSQSG